MDDHIAVDKFTDSGELVPTDPIEWLDGEDCPAGFQPAGTIGDEYETVAGEIFQEAGSGRVLVYLGLCGVPVPVLCPTRASFLRFAKEWLAPLAELNRSAAIDNLSDQIQEVLEELPLDELTEAQPHARSPAPRVDPAAGAN